MLDFTKVLDKDTPVQASFSGSWLKNSANFNLLNEEDEVFQKHDFAQFRYPILEIKQQAPYIKEPITSFLPESKASRTFKSEVLTLTNVV